MSRETGSATTEPQGELWGFSSHTYTKKRGLSTGPQPTKDALVSLVEYPVGVAISAVPVLPATRYPSINASEDSPSSDLASSSVGVWAVSAEIGFPITWGVGVYWKPSRTMDRITCGIIISPLPLATDEIAMTIWMGVTAMPCPNELVPSSASNQSVSPGSFNLPGASPARSIPVVRPKPKFCMYR